MRTLLILLAFSALTSLAFADGPADNNPETVRRLPKPGIEVPAAERQQLESGLATLKQSIDALVEKAKKDAKTRELLPDVQIYYKAVHDALKYNEILDAKELPEAAKQLTAGQQRAEQLLKGEAPWTTQTGLVVRGYVSKIDGSIQPYGLIVPETYTDKTPVGYRCDIWLHGRAEAMTELNFIRDRSSNRGTFTPERTIVLHPYGRWNNAFKLAGEIDVLEGLESVKERYAVDEDRVSIRGFSMGGAGAWHLAVHYPDMWFAANPGAGFSETPEFLKVFQKEDLTGKPWWEEKLWLMYDCNRYVVNLRNVPTIAYSGEEDSQKQAADVMDLAMQKSQQPKLVHVIGPKTKHAYHPDSKVEVETRMAALARAGRPQRPKDVALETYTLRYASCDWLTIDGLEAHWQRSYVYARARRLNGTEMKEIAIDAANVTDITLNALPGENPFVETAIRGIVVNGQSVNFGNDSKEAWTNLNAASDGSWNISIHSDNGKWKAGKRKVEGLSKKHGLQGPIDDAFLDSFLMVRPTSKAAHEAVEKWTLSECDRAIEHWRRHFRGEARVKNDSQITDDDIRNHNLVLWGDPSSNAVLAKIADKLPIRWGKDKIAVEKYGDFAADNHALIAIYPNPLNPTKYIVLNSGFTFREYAHLNNARQVPMLPDWAVVDLSVAPNTVWPGKIVAADFFDEKWGVKKSKEAETK